MRQNFRNLFICSKAIYIFLQCLMPSAVVCMEMEIEKTEVVIQDTKEIAPLSVMQKNTMHLMLNKLEPKDLFNLASTNKKMRNTLANYTWCVYEKKQDQNFLNMATCFGRPEARKIISTQYENEWEEEFNVDSMLNIPLKKRYHEVIIRELKILREALQWGSKNEIILKKFIKLFNHLTALAICDDSIKITLAKKVIGLPHIIIVKIITLLQIQQKFSPENIFRYANHKNLIKFSKRKWDKLFKKAKAEFTHIKLLDNIIAGDINVKKNLFSLMLYAYRQTKESPYFSPLEMEKGKIRSFIGILEILEERDDYELKNTVVITLGCYILDDLKEIKSFGIFYDIIHFFNKYSYVIIEDHRAFDKREKKLRKKIEKYTKEQKEVAEKIFDIMNQARELDSLKK